VLAYTPTTIGAESGTLQVTDEFRKQNVSLTGTGLAPPGVSATPSAIDFGGLAIGSTSAAQTVTVTNSGGYPLTGLAAAVSTGFTIAANGCSATLAVGSSCPIGLTFTPAAAGAVTGTLTVSAANLTNPLTVALSGAGEDFTIAVSGSSSAVVTSGQSASFTLQLAGVSGTSGTVALACSGLPANASCSVNPTTVAISASNTSSATLSIATGVSASAALGPAIHWTRAVPVFALFAPLCCIGLRRRKLGALAVVVLAAALLIPTGCGVAASGGSGGSGGGGGGSSGSTPPGTYVITVQATMSNIVHSTAVNLTVQ